MKSGMIAAETAFEHITKNSSAPVLLKEYPGEIVIPKTCLKYTLPETLEKSWVYEELKIARNMRPAFAKFGTMAGALYTGIDLLLLRVFQQHTQAITYYLTII